MGLGVFLPPEAITHRVGRWVGKGVDVFRAVVDDEVRHLPRWF